MKVLIKQRLKFSKKYVLFYNNFSYFQQLIGEKHKFFNIELFRNMRYIIRLCKNKLRKNCILLMLIFIISFSLYSFSCMNDLTETFIKPVYFCFKI